VTEETVTAVEAAAILGLDKSPSPAAAARRKLRRRGVAPIDHTAVPRRYPRAAVEAEAQTKPSKSGRPRTAPTGPFVTLPNSGARVDLGRLTPTARALAEVMAAQPLGAETAAIVLESRVPLRQLTPVEEWEHYGPAELDQPHRQVWRGWSSSYEQDDVGSRLEYQAATLPAGYVPVRPQTRQDWRAPSADAALADDELLSRDRVMTLLRHLGLRISLEEWALAQRRGDAREPTFVVGGQARWIRAEVTRYALRAIAAATSTVEPSSST
jgi:hypothetical protein